MRGKLIVIEGTDCSGKETQTKMLVDQLNEINIKCERFSFPNYSSPTGKIVGGPYLGKSYISPCWFEEGAINVDPKVSSLYYAADRKYNIKLIEDKLNSGVNIILDRYVYSNFAHQGGKIKDKNKRFEMYKWLEKLEFELLELPDADVKVFLHMPLIVSNELKKNREELPDQHEMSQTHLLYAEEAYKEISSFYNFDVIECSVGTKPKDIKDINKELFNIVISNLKNK